MYGNFSASITSDSLPSTVLSHAVVFQCLYFTGILFFWKETLPLQIAYTHSCISLFLYDFQEFLFCATLNKPKP